MRPFEQEPPVDQHPKARILLGLWLFSLASLVVIYLGSNKDGSLSLTTVAHKFYRTKLLISPFPSPSSSPLPSPPPSPSSKPSPSPSPSSSPSPSPSTLTNYGDQEFHGDELEEALAKAATENNTVILAVANKAYTEGDKPMLDIFLDAFWLGLDTHPLTKHLLIVAVDQTAYDRCNFLNLHCYKLKTEGVAYDGEKLYMSDDFIKMMWRRTLFLGEVLKHGYNFIFTDMDVLWLRNPFPRLTNESLDLQISCDHFNGDQWSDNNPINTGFYMIRSNEKTIELYDKWYNAKDYSPGKKEQDVLFDLMRGGEFKKLGLQVRFLDTIFFSGFCQNSRDVKVVSTIHANCCRSIRAKVSDLIAVLHDWKRFKAATGDDLARFKWTEHVACKNSWHRL